MKKFSEGIKDFFYDAIDYIVMIAIIVVVAGIIGWRLNALFDEDASSSHIVQKNKIETSKDKNSSDKNNTSVDSNTANKTDDKKTNDNNTNSNEIIKIVIPQGSPCSSIAGILQNKGLIADKGDFLAKAQEMHLDTKFKSGEFEIKKNSSIEDIIKTLTK